MHSEAVALMIALSFADSGVWLSVKSLMMAQQVTKIFIDRLASLASLLGRGLCLCKQLFSALQAGEISCVIGLLAVLDAHNALFNWFPCFRIILVERPCPWIVRA